MSVPTPPSLKIAPVLVLSSGRCGSTMISEILNTHPGVLSLSEFFIPLGPEAFAWSHPDGRRMWKTFSQQSASIHQWIKDGQVVDECLYPHDQPGSRYRAINMPPLIMVTLPHLTDQPEALLDELAPVISSLPGMPLGDHYRFLFHYLAQKFGNKVWVERSGGTLLYAAKMLRLFPEARVIHVYRDGRDTAMSMSNHHNFRVLIATLQKIRSFGINTERLFLKAKGHPSEVWMQNLLCRFLDGKKLLDRANLTLADFGAFWTEMILTGQKVLKDLPPDRLLNVKFEEVQQSPREKLRELIRYIDPSLEDEAWLDKVARIPRPARSKFTNLPSEEQEALTRACAPGLELLGYPL